MKRILVLVAIMLVTAVLVASAAIQPTSKPSPAEPKGKPAPTEQKVKASPYDKALAPTARRVQMACSNRTCDSPEFCGIPNTGTKCGFTPDCTEVAC
jgi:hypothetical protein